MFSGFGRAGDRRVVVSDVGFPKADSEEDKKCVAREFSVVVLEMQT